MSEEFNKVKPYRLLSGLNPGGTPVDYSDLVKPKEMTEDALETIFSSGTSTSIVNNYLSPSPLTTKGDVYTFDTANSRLAVGTNGQVLTADSAETKGIKWATPLTFSFVPHGHGGDGAVTLVANTTLAEDDVWKHYTTLALATFTLKPHANNPWAVIHASVAITASAGGTILTTSFEGASGGGAGGFGGDGGNGVATIIVIANSIGANVTIKANGADGTAGVNDAGGAGTGPDGGGATQQKWGGLTPTRTVGTQAAGTVGGIAAVTANFTALPAQDGNYKSALRVIGLAGNQKATVSTWASGTPDSAYELCWIGAGGSGGAGYTSIGPPSGGQSGGGGGYGGTMFPLAPGGNGGAAGTGSSDGDAGDGGSGPGGAGGGGGGSGGFAFVWCYSCDSTVTIQAKGGNGASGGDGASVSGDISGNGGGGGGGGGGIVAFLCMTQASPTLSVAGGSGGSAGVGSGSAGVAGSGGTAGLLYDFSQ